jgi:hypothetical protein
MTIASALGTAGHFVAEHKRAFIAGGAVAAGAGVLLALTACAPRQPKDGATFASDEFGAWDTAPADGSIALDEALVPMRHVYTKEREMSRFRSGDTVTISGYRETYETTWNSSIAPLVRAAGGTDAVASWEELGKFALDHYDTAGKTGEKDGVLSGAEQRAFLREYGPVAQDEHTELIARSAYTRQISDPQ